MNQLLVSELQPEEPLITFLDLLQSDDLLILQLPVLSFEVARQTYNLVELLISLDFS